MTATDYVGRPRAVVTPAWVDSLRVALPLWAGFTVLRWVVAVIATHTLSPVGFLDTTGVRKLVGTWDAGIFLAIATDGYPLARTEDPLRAAYFPGWPLAEHLVGAPLGLLLDHDAALVAGGVLLTTALSLVAAVLLHRITYDRFGRLAASWAVVLLMAWPSAAFLTTLYSESLYLVAAMGAWLLATRRRWATAGLVCGVASFTRITGAFLLVALVVMYLTTDGRRRFRWFDLGRVMLGAWGVVAFFAYLWVRTGDPVAWSHAQSDGWDRRTVAPWSSLSATWAVMTTGGLDNADWRWQTLADLVIVVIVLALAVVMARRRWWPELTLTVLTLGSVVTSTSYISVVRYTLSVFPLMILGGSLLSRWRPERAAIAVAASTAWMVAVMATFTVGAWAG